MADKLQPLPYQVEAPEGTPPALIPVLEGIEQNFRALTRNTETTQVLVQGGGGGGVPPTSQGDLLVGTASGLTTLPKDTNSTRYLANTGSANQPKWDQVNLTNGVTGDLPLSNLAGATAGDKLLGRDTGAGDWEELSIGSAFEVTSATLRVKKVIGLVVDGGGSVIQPGIKGDVRIPWDAIITKWTLLADVSGSIVIDIWKDTLANYPPTNAGSITASAPPTLSAEVAAEDSTLTGWTTSISAGDVLRFNVDSASTVTRVTLIIEVTL